MVAFIDIKAQQNIPQSNQQDSLMPVFVQAFSQSTKWKEAGAAVALLNIRILILIHQLQWCLLLIKSVE